MAAYAATVVLKSLHSVHLGPGTQMGVLRGTVDVTNYNQTLAEITAITGQFQDAPTVILEGVSDGGYLGNWVSASGAVKCWSPTDETGTPGDRAAAELASDTDAGSFAFVAFGRV